MIIAVIISITIAIIIANTIIIAVNLISGRVVD
jgi:hypothetical protein